MHSGKKIAVYAIGVIIVVGIVVFVLGFLIIPNMRPAAPAGPGGIHPAPLVLPTAA